MAQKGITPDEYRAAFELLCQDNEPDRITANMLQKAAGGRYGRASDALEKLVQAWRQKQVSQQLIPVQPGWYREFVAAGIESTRELMEGLWANIGPHIEERILESTSKLEGQRDALKQKFEEDRSQIELLENELESAEQQLIDRSQLISELREKLKQSGAVNQRKARESERTQELLQQRADSQLKAERALEDVKRERDTVAGRLEALRDDHGQLKEQMADVVQKKADLFAGWSAQNQKLQELEPALEKERQSVSTLQLENQSLKTRVEEQNRRIRELSARSGQQEHDNRELVRQLAIVEQALIAAQKPAEALSDVERDQLPLVDEKPGSEQ